jgi:hypothetical protein
MTVILEKQVQDFIESSATIIDEGGDKYYWLPVYFRKIEDGLFEVLQFKDTASGLTHIVEQSEKRNPDE